MKHIRIFESFNLSEAGTGYNSWKAYGDINDLADTLNKKITFERNIRATFKGIPGMEKIMAKARMIMPVIVKNAWDFHKFMEVFDILGNPPMGVFDLSTSSDLSSLESLNDAAEGFYVLRNSTMVDTNILNRIGQKSPEAVFIKIEERKLSSSETDEAVRYAQAGNYVMLQEDPDFFILL
jgi:predicted nuclease of predicted toxin-antitoxin system